MNLGDEDCTSIHVAAHRGNDTAVMSFINDQVNVNSKLSVSILARFTFKIETSNQCSTLTSSIFSND